jgi:hypothetical protein
MAVLMDLSKSNALDSLDYGAPVERKLSASGYQERASGHQEQNGGTSGTVSSGHQERIVGTSGTPQNSKHMKSNNDSDEKRSLTL